MKEYLSPEDLEKDTIELQNFLKKTKQEQVGEFTTFLGVNRWHQMAKFTEEVEEAVNVKDDPIEFAKEATDVIIVCLGLIHQAGLSFDTLFDEKMATNWKKYAEVPRLKELGLKHSEAIVKIRQAWAKNE